MQPKTTQAIVKLFLDKGDLGQRNRLCWKEIIFLMHSRDYWNNLSFPKLESAAANILEKISCPPKSHEDWLYKDFTRQSKTKEPMSAENLY